ncbi:hypothetical protein RVW32_000790 [Citrobacter amalonaticus]|nr:hypothetical protein [Citrobacter amalonaticus]
MLAVNQLRTEATKLATSLDAAMLADMLESLAEEVRYYAAIATLQE